MHEVLLAPGIPVAAEAYERQTGLCCRVSAKLRPVTAMTVESEDHVRLADRIVFPYPETRESQRVLVEDLDDAVGAGLLLVCSAPTGTGKTAAALFPLVRRGLAE